MGLLNDSIKSCFGIRRIPFCANTNSLYDFQIGRFVRGLDGKYYIDGGINRSINGITGRKHTFKSSFMLAMLIRAIYYLSKRCEGTLIDVEESIARDEIRAYQIGGVPISMDQLNIVSGAGITVKQAMASLLEMCKIKKENEKNYLIKCPLIDPATGKEAIIYVPSFLSVDTISNLRDTSEDEMLASADAIDDGKTNTIFMKPGRNKTIFTTANNAKCSEMGIYTYWCAHEGEVNNMGDVTPKPKQLGYMRQGYKIKGTGSKFDELTVPLVEVVSAKKLLGSDNASPLYGEEGVAENDQFEIIVQVLRGKMNASGISCPYVMSQTLGFMNDLTNYNFLRSNDYFGLIGNKQNHKNALLPDINLTRNNVQGQFEKNPQLKRAMEIIAQLCFIQTKWSIDKVPPGINIRMTPEEIYKNMTSKKLTDRILNSRGYWCAEDGVDAQKEYLSVPDVIALLQS